MLQSIVQDKTTGSQSLGEDNICNYLVDVSKYLTRIIWPSIIVASINKRLPSLVGDKVFGKYYDVSAKDYEPMRDVQILAPSATISPSPQSICHHEEQAQVPAVQYTKHL